MPAVSVVRPAECDGALGCSVEPLDDQTEMRPRQGAVGSALSQDQRRACRDAVANSSTAPTVRLAQPTGGATSSVIELSTATSDAKLSEAGRAVRAALLLRAPTLVRNRKQHLATFRRCMLGTEMVDWLSQQYTADGTPAASNRLQAVGCWQALLEHGILLHVTHEYPFMDKNLFYRWAEDENEQVDDAAMPSPDDAELPDALRYLATVGPDALFRMILQKPPSERQLAELEVVFDELMHVKALAHLSTMVKRELAGVVYLEKHAHAGTVIIRQGDMGKSWYIILRGSVNVSLVGKGVVCTLYEGDDFGKLALVNDAPRAATVTLQEDNCHLLRVDKDHFNRILRDVETNTLRLKEHDIDVLVLARIPAHDAQTALDAATNPGSVAALPQHRYSVMAGKSEKILEYLIETRIDSRKADVFVDTFLEDFILTHSIFMPTNCLSNSLINYYKRGCSSSAMRLTEASGGLAACQLLECKTRVVAFLQQWIAIVGREFFQDAVANAFVEELYSAVVDDARTAAELVPARATMDALMGVRERAMQLSSRAAGTVLDCGVYRSDAPSPIRPIDNCVLPLFDANGSSVALTVRMDKTAAEISRAAVHRLNMGGGDDIELVEVKASGERIAYQQHETSIATTLSLNGRLVVAYSDQIDSLLPLPHQMGPTVSTQSATLELLGSHEIASLLAANHSRLLVATHESELISQVLGRQKFRCVAPSNLDMLIRRFNEVQFWCTTEVVLCRNLAKRAQLIKKFIKVATQCRLHQDLMSFFSIILGLSNVAVSRLQATWDKVPAKLRKQFEEFENLLSPSRNHRAYRMLVSKLRPPIIPFVPLILKDLRFIHDGNKTHFEGLVNFEKMHMIAQVLRQFRFCNSRPFGADDGRCEEAAHLVRNFIVVDCQRRLLDLSHALEPPRPPAARS